MGGDTHGLMDPYPYGPFDYEHVFETSLTSFTSSFGPSAAAAGVLSSLMVGDADAPFGVDPVTSTLWFAYLLRSTPPVATSVQFFGRAIDAAFDSVIVNVLPSALAVRQPVTVIVF